MILRLGLFHVNLPWRQTYFSSFHISFCDIIGISNFNHQWNTIETAHCNHLVNIIIFGKIFKAHLAFLRPVKQSVSSDNVIVQLLWSVIAWHKMTTLSSTYCNWLLLINKHCDDWLFVPKWSHYAAYLYSKE